MSEAPYTYLANLADEPIPHEGTLSRTLHQSDTIKAVLFAFDTGQELSEHTASMPAIIQIVRGQAHLTLGDDAHEVGPGAWIHMPARLSHSIVARTPLVMLLLLLKGDKPASRPEAAAT